MVVPAFEAVRMNLNFLDRLFVFVHCYFPFNEGSFCMIKILLTINYQLSIPFLLRPGKPHSNAKGSTVLGAKDRQRHAGRTDQSRIRIFAVCEVVDRAENLEAAIDSLRRVEV